MATTRRSLDDDPRSFVTFYHPPDAMGTECVCFEWRGAELEILFASLDELWVDLACHGIPRRESEFIMDNVEHARAVQVDDDYPDVEEYFAAQQTPRVGPWLRLMAWAGIGAFILGAWAMAARVVWWAFA